MLYRLIYASRVAPGVGMKEIRAILEASHRNNARHAVTGVLVFNAGYFFQWLEGGRAAISERFARISNDPRHTQVELLAFDAVSARRFTDWQMGYLGEGVINQELFLRYSSTGEFSPSGFSGESAEAFLQEAAQESLRLQARSPEQR